MDVVNGTECQLHKDDSKEKTSVGSILAIRRCEFGSSDLRNAASSGAGAKTRYEGKETNQSTKLNNNSMKTKTLPNVAA
ncbi:unnamed protein product [Gongylonema pulchrum]|uniref:Uncharacterized protein n=1 Tax=Gongylonema pulchrum TaxID=637853 RepID=A0A183DJ18_9BILA|nr:unnamed protein product [Gongylonema pulchrum]